MRQTSASHPATCPTAWTVSDLSCSLKFSRGCQPSCRCSQGCQPRSETGTRQGAAHSTAWSLLRRQYKIILYSGLMFDLFDLFETCSTSLSFNSPLRCCLEGPLRQPGSHGITLLPSHACTASNTITSWRFLSKRSTRLPAERRLEQAEQDLVFFPPSQPFPTNFLYAAPPPRPCLVTCMEEPKCDAAGGSRLWSSHRDHGKTRSQPPPPNPSLGPLRPTSPLGQPGLARRRAQASTTQPGGGGCAKSACQYAACGLREHVTQGRAGYDKDLRVSCAAGAALIAPP